MKIKWLILSLALLTGKIYACEGVVENYVTSIHASVVQVLKSDKIIPGSSIFFYYAPGEKEHPDIKASFAPNRCAPGNNMVFDSFPYDGSVASIDSVFFGKSWYSGKLFIIVSWVYNMDGVNTVGKYYETFVYDYSKDKNRMMRNEEISSIFSGGHDGFFDGKPVKYKFKTAEDVWDHLNKLGSMAIKQ